MWTHANSPEAYARAMALARGEYQRDVIAGIHNLSGSSLTGKMRAYSLRYATSRANLIARLRAAGIPVAETTGSHNRRILVVG